MDIRKQRSPRGRPARTFLPAHWPLGDVGKRHGPCAGGLAHGSQQRRSKGRLVAACGWPLLRTKIRGSASAGTSPTHQTHQLPKQLQYGSRNHPRRESTDPDFRTPSPFIIHRRRVGAPPAPRGVGPGTGRDDIVHRHAANQIQVSYTTCRRDPRHAATWFLDPARLGLGRRALEMTRDDRTVAIEGRRTG